MKISVKVRLLSLIIAGLSSVSGYASLPPAEDGTALPTKEGFVEMWDNYFDSRADLINLVYEGIDMKVKDHDITQIPDVMQEIDLLEGYLRREIDLKDGSLKHVDCKRCVCQGC